MPRVERVPGRRRAEAPPRRPRSTRDEGGSVPAEETPASFAPPPAGAADGAPGGRPPRPRRPTTGTWSTHRGTALGLLWVFLVALGAGGLVAGQVADSPTLVQRSVAAAVGVLLALGLTVRAGGRVLPTTLLAAAVGVAAVVTGWAPLLGGAALGTGVLAACLAVLGTTPAATFGRVIREIVLAQLLALAGALAVAGFRVPLDLERFGYTVLAVSLGAALALVYRLGAGFRGLGRRGLVVGVAALVLLAVTLAYTEALATWGSPEMTRALDAVKGWTRDRLGAVPHPIEVLLGLPALAWGVFMRARRRQGWWVCAFGVTATAPATTRLIEVGVDPLTTLLSAVYSLVLGLVLGYVVIRLEQAFQGTRGRRARRGEEATAHRPEPQRLRALH